tara:strand:- start:105 stop:1148 length:1044 start_codon:yes stop_codon:yes gene_type:complete
MNEIVQYINTSFYKNDDIENLKSINKYISKLKELDPIKINENRNINSYKYNILDIFKYIDPLFWDNDDIHKLYEKFPKHILDKIGQLEFYNTKKSGDNTPYTIKTYAEYFELSRNQTISYNIVSSNNENKKINENYTRFGGTITFKNGDNIEKVIEIKEYYDWHNEAIIDVIYDKYLLKEYMGQSLYILKCSLLLKLSKKEFVNKGWVNIMRAAGASDETDMLEKPLSITLTFSENCGWNLNCWQSKTLDSENKQIGEILLDIVVCRKDQYFGAIEDTINGYTIEGTSQDLYNNIKGGLPAQPTFNNNRQKKQWLKKIIKKDWLINSKGEYIFCEFWSAFGWDRPRL